MTRPAWSWNADSCRHLVAVRVSALPVRHSGLRQASLVKNGRLESVLELYRGESTGSAQIDLAQAHIAFGMESSSHPDIILLRGVALLPSFDSFSLRLLLRECGIEATTLAGLAPSPDRQRQIDAELGKYTLPLLRYVYAGEDIETVTLATLLDSFRKPNLDIASAQLTRLATKLGLELSKLFAFLELYADTFMAISLYRVTLRDLEPAVENFLEAIRSLAREVEKTRNHETFALCAQIDESFRFVLKMANVRLTASQRVAELIWGTEQQVPARNLKPRLREFHLLIGYLVAGLSAKLATWYREFPLPDSGTVRARTKLLSGEMRYAMTQLREWADGTKTKGRPEARLPPALEDGSLQQYLRMRFMN